METKKDFIKIAQDDTADTSLSSTKLTQTSKGVNIEVKVYDPNPSHAAEKAQKLFDSLRKRYATS